MSESQSRLRWLCRRGMKELDVVLTRYLDERYDTAERDQQAAFVRLLEMQDPTVFALLLGREQCDDEAISKLLQVLTNSSNKS
ncbi:MAG: succinate dehydrogenase assembly factor 2 [Pseudomonadota bacterium]